MQNGAIVSGIWTCACMDPWSFVSHHPNFRQSINEH